MLPTKDIGTDDLLEDDCEDSQIFCWRGMGDMGRPSASENISIVAVIEVGGNMPRPASIIPRTTMINCYCPCILSANVSACPLM